MAVDWEKVAASLKHAADDLDAAVRYSKPARGQPDETLAVLAEEIEDVYVRVRDEATRYARAAETGS